MISYEIDESVEQNLETKSFKGFKLKTFPNLSKWLNCTLLNFSFNPLENFQGLQSLPNLKILYLDNTQLSSFIGVPELNSLEMISIKLTPINAYKKADIMCAIAFPKLIFVNGEEIKRDRYRFAKQNREALLPFLYNGWLLTSINPIRFIHSKTRKRITIKTPSIKKKENVSSKNTTTVQPKKISKGENDEKNQEEEEKYEIIEVHSEHTVYSASESTKNEEQLDPNVQKTMKDLTNDLTTTSKKRSILNKTVIDESENKKKYNNKEPVGMRHILRRPGGFKDPFKFNYAITVKQKPIPDVPPPIPRPTLTINSKPYAQTLQPSSNNNNNFTPEGSLNDSDNNSYSFQGED